jgi:hypothetical protein
MHAQGRDFGASLAKPSAMIEMISRFQRSLDAVTIHA